jgi:hypothetical protein
MLGFENLRGFGIFRFQVMAFGIFFENHAYKSKPIIGFLNAWLCICENLPLLGAPFFFLITIKCWVFIYYYLVFGGFWEI